MIKEWEERVQKDKCMFVSWTRDLNQSFFFSFPRQNQIQSLMHQWTKNDTAIDN